MSIFSKVPVSRPRRTAFNLSHEVKLSCNMGSLVPILCREVVPGDTFKLSSEIFMRFAPMLAPIMHRVNVYTHFFFVPNRIVWDNWEEFITGGEDGNSMPVHPFINMPDVAGGESSALLQNGSLADYFGLPTSATPSTLWPENFHVDSLPFRGYAKIWNEYYRDQNLQEEIDIPYGDGDDTSYVDEILQLRNRAWEKDYFTSALPWAQRGGDVSLPITGDAPVVYTSGAGLFVDSGVVTENNNSRPFYAGEGLDGTTGSEGSLSYAPTDSPTSRTTRSVGYDPDGSLEADLSAVTSATINDLRQAFALQRWLEINARGGSRYTEQIFSHFGVRSSDGRLQRPEYLGGGRAPVQISEVLQTSATEDESPQANMAGHGLAVGNTNRFRRFFEEHGYVIGIMSVLPRTTYQQGVPRQFRKFDKFDYYFPEFAHLGEQPIYPSEIYVDETTDDAGAPFGYTPRYAEYKYIPSQVCGDFKSTLAFWHLGRIFGSAPTLNGAFTTARVGQNGSIRSDIFAVQDPDDHHLWVSIYNSLLAVRPMPKFGVPRLIG